MSLNFFFEPALRRAHNSTKNNQKKPRPKPLISIQKKKKKNIWAEAQMFQIPFSTFWVPMEPAQTPVQAMWPACIRAPGLVCRVTLLWRTLVSSYKVLSSGYSMGLYASDCHGPFGLSRHTAVKAGVEYLLASFSCSPLLVPEERISNLEINLSPALPSP
ncbi:hypothetical protein DM02DRAFT_402397 [Periconia macrospinosa]|uniref:Uncharacterized protein n=1 Tax=Periconia macrospinosa TaxID=97972 RepID=A0A2V1DSD7_9PLEO|nr:hypothetical protein DM02DRAFT_402397 [Periconia macrospinosa]